VPALSGAVRLLAFRIEGLRCAVPLELAERVLPMIALSPLPGAPEAVLGLLNLEGKPLPVVDLGRRLLLPPHDYGLAAHLLLVRTRHRRMAIATDEVQGLTEVPVADVSPASKVLAGRGPMAGAVALSDGILLIQDVEAFLSLEEQDQLDLALVQKP
jgi:purine-binding chemotaxis protein CheW